MRRWGSWIIVFYFDGEVRGQIECRTEQERELWSKLTEHLNSKQE